jgi:hypothetical protein
MPSGYTHGVVTGKVTTLKVFAESCMRAFGACIHMKDESSDKKYEKREMSEYHQAHIESAKIKRKAIEDLSDEQIIKKTTTELEASIRGYEKTIKDKKVIEKRIDSLLEKAKAWQPPTSDHENIKEFMIEQLTDTKKHDADYKYDEELIETLQNELDNLDPTEVRATMLDNVDWDINYHQKALEKEQNNEWVEQLLNSIEN